MATPAQISTFASAPLLKLEAARQIPGHERGMRSPLALARLSLSGGSNWSAIADRAIALLNAQLPGFASSAANAQAPRLLGQCEPAASEFVKRLLRLVESLDREIGLPVLDPPQAVGLTGSTGDDASGWLLVMPSYSPRASIIMLAWLIAWLKAVSTSSQGEAWPAALDRLINELNRLAPSGTSARHFVRAAHELRIPWLVLPGGTIQYGWGKRARLLQSTFTDETPSISTRIARDKTETNELLSHAGLPVPAQARVRTVRAAEKAAQALGYPVVIKPANLDGGRGVSAGLNGPADVRKAFDRAIKYSRHILVEKHADGRDYRILVFRGQALWAFERVPGGVTGDGRRSLRELIADANLDPRRGTRRWAHMTPLVIDEEANELLGLQGLQLQSIPPAGRFVRLRRAANISTGGTPVPAYDAMHPDNAALAVRAARVMRLDVAGIDLITPDITRSWRETGAVICEVNAQPQMSITGPHVYAQLLRGLVQGQGRIPTAIVLGTAADEELARQAGRILASGGLCVGMSTPKGLTIAGECVRDGRRSAFADARALMIDPAVEVIVIVAQGPEFLSSGLPFDRFDALVVATWDEPTDHAPLLSRMLDLAAAHCDGEALIRREHPHAGLIAQGAAKIRPLTVTSSQQLAVRLAHLLRVRHAAHSRVLHSD